VTWEALPGFVEEREAYGETTVIVERERLLEAARWLRDEGAFNFLSDITPTDYLGWNRERVAGYWGDPRGRDINAPGSWGLQAQPEPKPKRFSVSYHLLGLRPGAAETQRLRVQVWCEEDEPLPSVVSVWPTADWHLTRILMDDDWVGHPLRKDYPLGGEPVRFSGQE
jgi:NADH-quinone oxidoreductase subunit C